MPIFTPAQRRALSALPEFADDLRTGPEEPLGPPYTHETAAALALARSSTRILTDLSPNSTAPTRRPRPPRVRTLDQLTQRLRAAATPGEVLAAACFHYGAGVRQARTAARSRALAAVRAVVSRELHRRGMSYPEIARFLRLGTHSAAVSAAQRAERRFGAA